MLEKLADIAAKYDDLNRQLQDPHVTQDPKRYRDLSKEQASLRELVETYREFLKIKKQLSDNHDLLADADDDLRQLVTLLDGLDLLDVPVLAEICDSVYSIEVVPELGERAMYLLKKLGYENIKLKTGDGYKGWKEHAPFDAIIVTCSPTHIPKPLEDQLVEGGRMIIPVGKKYVQQLVYLIKKKGELHKKKVLPVAFVPMLDEKGEVY